MNGIPSPLFCGHSSLTPPVQILLSACQTRSGSTLGQWRVPSCCICRKTLPAPSATSNVVLGRIHQVIGNLVQTLNISQIYVDKNDPWIGILAAAVLAIRSTTNRQKGYSPDQLIFGCDIILLIKHTVGWELILQMKHTQINKYNIH